MTGHAGEADVTLLQSPEPQGIAGAGGEAGPSASARASDAAGGRTSEPGAGPAGTSEDSRGTDEPGAGGEVIPVFFNTDDRYAIPTYIALYSLLKNHRSPEKIHAYILVPSAFGKEYEGLLTSLPERFPNAEVEVIHMAEHYESVRINIGYISTASLYRLMIPRIVKDLPGGAIGRCIYLDSDLVVEGDISELFRIDMDGQLLCGIRDRFLSGPDRSDTDIVRDVQASLGIPTMSGYINSGVLLMDIDGLDRSGMSARLLEEGYNQTYRYNDQDVFNKVLYGRIKHLPIRYNTFAPFIYLREKAFTEIYGAEHIRAARRDPFIVHFVAERKPWASRWIYLASHWRKYVREQDPKVRKDLIDPFTKALCVPFGVRLRDMVKTAAIHLHLYNLTRDVYHLLKGKR